MTVGAYDAKKERLYGILRQTPSVLSLAVIFFLALSAQASAKTYIQCVAETFAVHRGNEIPRKMRSNERLLFSFDADNGSRFENPKIEGTDCIPSTTSKGGAFFSGPDSISIKN